LTTLTEDREDTMAAHDTASNPLGWLGADPSEWLKAWSAAMRAVPHALDQSINPGWFSPVLNIGNSSAPQTEVQVLQQHSYGRQLGRISDALAVLIAERPRGAKANKGIAAFTTMKAQIDAIKLEAAGGRVDQVCVDLAALKTSNPREYERLRAVLLAAL
jgi:hypothetical protein